jgi:hypothetical protein
MVGHVPGEDRDEKRYCQHQRNSDPTDERVGGRDVIVHLGQRAMRLPLLRIHQ